MTTTALLQKINDNPGTGIEAKRELVGGISHTYIFTRDKLQDMIYTGQYYGLTEWVGLTGDQFLQNFNGAIWTIEERVKII